MAQEIKVSNYYSEIKNEEFVDSNICCKLGMEFLISQLLYKGDISRVLYSKEDICFRKRVELLGDGDVKNGSMNYKSLNLPFSVYSQTGSYEPDDRVASMNSGAAIRGIQELDNGIIVKHMPVKIEYSITSFFSRRDDVNIASQLLYWESNPKAPLYFIVKHTLCGEPIDIPVFMTIENTDMNPEYGEKDWLEKAKIFPIKTKVIIRTYQTLIEYNNKKSQWLPLRFSGLHGYNTDNEVVFTQDAVLEWVDLKWQALKKGPSTHWASSGAILRPDNYNTPGLSDEELEEEKKEFDEVFDDYGKLVDSTLEQQNELYATLVEKSEIEEKLETLGEELEQAIEQEDDLLVATLTESIDKAEEEKVSIEKEVELLSEVVTGETVSGYFCDYSLPMLSVYHIIEEENMERSLTVEWAVNPEMVEEFDYLTVYIPGIINQKISADIMKFTITGLYPGSDYQITLLAYDITGANTVYTLNGKTKGEIIYTSKGSKLSDQLVGKTWGTSYSGIVQETSTNTLPLPSVDKCDPSTEDIPTDTP